MDSRTALVGEAGWFSLEGTATLPSSSGCGHTSRHWARVGTMGASTKEANKREPGREDPAESSFLANGSWAGGHMMEGRDLTES